jgi:uncharacterized damage-inducible protein DinB
MSMNLHEVFEYDAYANEKVWHGLQAAGRIPDTRIPALFGHLVGAHHVWLCRIGGSEPALDIWPALSLEQMGKQLKQNEIETGRLLQHQDLNEVVQYHNSKGKAFENNIRDILYHVANHSNYHRGQIAARMRDAGLEPVATDYIFYKRQDK